MKFSHTHTDAGMTVNYEVPEHASLSEVLESFTDFLRGCGYVIPYDEYLDYVKDHEDEETFEQEKRESYHDYMARRLRETSGDPYVSDEMLHE